MALSVFTLLLSTVLPVPGVKVIKVEMPDAALISSTIKAKCQVDLEEDILYSLKWYLNSTEVSTFVPSKSSKVQFFLPQLALSKGPSWNELIIGTLDWVHEGNWLCEVYADKTFQRAQASRDFVVIAPPTEAPSISGFKVTYGIHETVDTLCTPPLAKPHPKLLWLINEQPAPMEFTSLINGTSLRLHFPLQVHHLQSQKSKFSLRCIASFKFNQSLYETSLRKNSSLPASNSSQKLIIYGLQNKFKVGDLLKLTCHFAGEDTDTVQMHWQVNYRKIPSLFIIKYARPQFLGIRLTLQPWHLDHLGRVSVKCVAGKIFKLAKSESHLLTGSSVCVIVLANTLNIILFNSR